MTLPRGLVLLIGGTLLSGLVRGADGPPTPPPRAPVPTLPSAAVLAYAAAQDWPTDHIPVATTPSDGREGDRIIALITLRDKGATKQWLTRFEIADLTAKEREAAKPTTLNLTLLDRKFNFSATPSLALDIRTAGPFLPDRKVPAGDKRARTLISPDYLGLGLDQACRYFEEAAHANKASPQSPPVTPSETTVRTIAGTVPAMFAFFQGVQTTPGLREILWNVIEKPSLWSIAKRGGRVDAGFNIIGGSRIDLAEWGLPGVECYQMSLKLSLNDKLALSCTFFVTSPRPPLLTSAGIVGIIAEPPGQSGKKVEIRVLAARRPPSVSPPQTVTTPPAFP